MRYRLRTLLILLAVGPPILAALWIIGWEGLFATILFAGVGLAAAAVLSVVGGG